MTGDVGLGRPLPIYGIPGCKANPNPGAVLSKYSLTMQPIHRLVQGLAS